MIENLNEIGLDVEHPLPAGDYMKLLRGPGGQVGAPDRHFRCG